MPVTFDETIHALMLWAATLTGYELPDELPSLKAVNQQVLMDKLCGGEKCNVVAYYDHHTQTVIYDEQMNILRQRKAQGFVVHEFVHHLQYLNSAISVSEMSCEQRVVYEKEAYRVQRHFLREHDVNPYPIDLARAALDKICE